MLGLLPTKLDVNGVSYNIRSDYRDILRIFSAFNAPELSDREKTFVLLKQMYVDFSEIPYTDYEAAYKAAFDFIDGSVIHEDRPSPRIVNWEKDEQLIFPAVNKVAGFEVRSADYLHWWTFLGYFQGIDRDDTWGFVLLIRQKRAKHKQLEKHEREFYAANRKLCMVDLPKDPEKVVSDTLTAIYNDLLKGGADND